MVNPRRKFNPRYEYHKYFKPLRYNGNRRVYMGYAHFAVNYANWAGLEPGDFRNQASLRRYYRYMVEEDIPNTNMLWAAEELGEFE